MDSARTAVAKARARSPAAAIARLFSLFMIGGPARPGISARARSPANIDHGPEIVKFSTLQYSVKIKSRHLEKIKMRQGGQMAKSPTFWPFQATRIL